MIESVLARAKREFLTGTGFSSPFQAINAGLKTVEEWSLCLDRCRDEAAEVKSPSRPQGKGRGRPRSGQG
ncbi:hypothetical protein [Deinococcus roseus]|uniref:Uncharacterized protein n=1 Tax=Deinococcus roseus TaxID=392414 RepID=A0ABQ2D0S3_9DEIO|nr:hypothetical protein [Deinococcus roseus]GGJ28522.1 hypothetical protein GCM10008938_13260 [Deinococcus roseus]